MDKAVVLLKEGRQSISRSVAVVAIILMVVVFGNQSVKEVLIKQLGRLLFIGDFIELNLG
jgi:hypothetical protein